MVPPTLPARPWFKRPSVAWILCMKTLSSVAAAISAGPRVEILTEIVCRAHYHDHESPSFLPLPLPPPSLLPTHPVHVYLPPDRPFYSSAPPPRCARDPLVQAGVAQLIAVLAFISGLLSCLTTGWWGGCIDRYGRTRILGIVVLAPLVGDLLTCLVFFYSHNLPGGYWFMLLFPLFEGILGSPSSTLAAETSYMRDVSEPHNLSRNFSLLVGIYYTGGTIGPILGGLLNQRTGNVISALYATTVLHFAFALVAWFAMPESITPAAMLHARNRYDNELASVVDAHVGPVRRRVMVLTKSFWDSFPLNVLAPKRLPNSRRKKDWNLTWLALSAGLINAIMGSCGSVFQYALYTFRWSSLQLGYFISASGLSTAVFLTAILPTMISIIKRATTADARQNTLFDLNLLRASSVVIAVGYALMGLAPTGLVFTLCYVVTTFGQGFVPAVQSVATILHARASGEDDAGRLFSALGVAYVIGGRVVGPALYGTVYSATVSYVPSAIFWVSAGCSVVVFVVLALVRLPDVDTDMSGSGSSAGEETDLQRDETEPLLVRPCAVDA